jgi:hypothetical protein
MNLEGQQVIPETSTRARIRRRKTSSGGKSKRPIKPSCKNSAWHPKVDSFLRET